jgi:hypothetical protein
MKISLYDTQRKLRCPAFKPPPRKSHENFSARHAANPHAGNSTEYIFHNIQITGFSDVNPCSFVDKH